jgi:hypothetical protein
MTIAHMTVGVSELKKKTKKKLQPHKSSSLKLNDIVHDKIYKHVYF